MRECTKCKRKLGFNESYYLQNKKIVCDDCLFKETNEEAENKLSDLS